MNTATASGLSPVAATRAVFGQSPLDVIAPIEIATDALDWLGAILLGIEALGEREAPDLESIKHLTAVGRYVASTVAENIGYSHEQMEARIKDAMGGAA